MTNGATINGTLITSDITSQSGNITLTEGSINLTEGNLTLTNGTINTENLQVEGTSTLTGLLDANGGAEITSANGNNSLTVDNTQTTIVGNLLLENGTIDTQTLQVDGNATVDGLLDVNGGIDVTGGATISSGTNQITVGNNVTNNINNRNLVSGTDINGGLNVDGTFAASIDADGVGIGTDINSITLGESRNITVGAQTLSVGTSVDGGLAADRLAVSGNSSIGGTLDVVGNTSVGGTFTSTGLLTANGGATINQGATVNGGFSSFSGNGAGNQIALDGTSARMVSGANSVVVGATQQATIGDNAFSYGTTTNGGMLVNGDLGVNGNIYTLNPTANASIQVGNNGLNVAGTTNEVTLTSDNDNNLANGGAQVAITTESAALTLTNEAGNVHGIAINNNQTVISGGTTTGVLTLNDNGATFSDSDGAPIKVTGVADGTSTYDAVNYGQLTRGLNEVRSGISAVSAMANIPQVDPNKKFSLGAGYGTFMNTQAFAVGGSARIDDDVVVKASFAQSTHAKPTFGVGVGYSW